MYCHTSATLLLAGAACCALVFCPLASAAPLQDQAAAPAPGGAAGDLRYRVLEVRGSAKWGSIDLESQSTEGWQPVKVGDRYGGGTQIHTGIRTKVKLVMEPADPPTIIMIGPLALTSVDELGKRADGAVVAKLGLAYGEIRAGVAEGETRSEMQIRSPVATLSKRGTWDFRFFVERGTGRWEMSLAERGLLEAIHHATGKTQFVQPGQFINQIMARWIEAIRFNRVSVQDVFGLQGSDLDFSLDNGTGLGIFQVGADSIGILNIVNRQDRTDGGPMIGGLFDNLTNQTQGIQQLRLFQALQDRLNQNLNRPFRLPDGDFGIGTGTVPVLGPGNSGQQARRILGGQGTLRDKALKQMNLYGRPR